MKKILILVLVSLVFFLISCSGGRKNFFPISEQTEIIHTAASEAENSYDDTENSHDPNKPDFSQLELFAENLYLIPLKDIFSSSEQYTLTQIFTNREYILAVYSDNQNYEEISENAVLILLNSRTGEVISTCLLPADNTFRLLDEGKISAINTTTLETYIYTSDFSQICHYDALETEIDSTFAFVTNNGKKLYYSDENSKTMVIVNLSDKSKKIIETGITFPYYTGFNDGKIYISSYDEQEKNYYMDTTSDTVRCIQETDGFFSVGTAQPLFMNVDISSFIKTAENPDVTYILQNLTYDTGIADFLDGLLLTRKHSESAVLNISAYDITNKKVYSQNLNTLDLDISIVGQIKLTDYGTALIDLYTDDYTPMLCIWDIFSAEEESFLLEALGENGVSGLNTQIRDEIFKNHGIEVYYGEEGNRFNAPDYTAETETDSFKLYRSMRTLSDTLDKYPKGIFQEMCVNGIKGIKIYLCGAFHGTQYGTISSAAAIAFTDYKNNHRIIALDIAFSYLLEQNISHELMHIMDDRILMSENETGIPYYSMWDMFLPQNMTYYYSYLDGNGNEISDTSYTIAGESEENNIYFIDAYSKTFPTEDRARIMEYLFISDSESLSSSIYGPHLTEKAYALCLILREVFPSVAACSDIPWEKSFEKLGNENFEDFLNRYNEYTYSWEAVG